MVADDQETLPAGLRRCARSCHSPAKLRSASAGGNRQTTRLDLDLDLALDPDLDPDPAHQATFRSLVSD
jgi:hypothetical protein